MKRLSSSSPKQQATKHLSLWISSPTFTCNKLYFDFILIKQTFFLGYVKEEKEMVENVFDQLQTSEDVNI